MFLIGLFCLAVDAAERQDSDDWPMYGRNLQHTFDNPDSAITPNNVAQLRPAWIFPAGDVVSASPAVVDGVVYTGSWDGYFYALDARSGQLKWKFRLDCQTTVVPVPEVCGGPPPGPDPRRFTTPGGIVTASPTVSDGRVYFAGGKTVYTLKTSDGTLLWKRVICGRPEHRDCASDANDPTQVLSSPALFDGRIFFGADTGGVEFEIPYRGGFVALDAKTGRLIWRIAGSTEKAALMEYKIGAVAMSGRLRQSISGFGWSSSARLIARNSLCRPITAASLRSTPTPEASGGCSGRARATRTNATLISERRPI
jgi:polyvinyl alcohol dehydrogenase (cytochrome)